MIVRDEGSIIHRALASVWPHVDEWCIVDTGSVDDTVEQIHNFVGAAPKPGSVHSRPWHDFGTNRTEALALARATSATHWLLMMDADDTLHCAQDIRGLLAARPAPAAYKVRVAFAEGHTYRLHLFNRAAAWAYAGSRHECPVLPEGGALGIALGILPREVHIRARTEGARSRNPDKYRDDALALEAELASSPGDTRCLFYIAQSWRDAHAYDRALALYKAVVAANGWGEERYIACLNIVWLESSDCTALAYAWQAVDIQPQRVEAAVAVLERFRRAALPKPQLLAMAAYLLPRAPSPEFLFVDAAAYAWKLADEATQLALACGQELPCAVPVAAAPLEQQPRLRFTARVAAECAATATALTYADCLPAGARVYVHPPLPLFRRPAELVQAWIAAAGCTCVPTLEEATLQLCFLDVAAGTVRLTVPLIVVATEQPSSCLYTDRLLRLYASAAWVWCMDNVDYAFLQAHGLRRLKVLPLMFGTYYMPAFVCVPHTTQTDVLQFGTKNARRDAVMVDIAARCPQARCLYVDSVYDERELSALLLSTRVVVVPAYWHEPVTYGLHRLAFLMHFPGVAIVVEEAPASVYNRYILDAAAGGGQQQHIRIVPYAALAETVAECLRSGPSLAAAVAPSSLFADKLLAWDGVAPWTSLLQ